MGLESVSASEDVIGDPTSLEASCVVECEGEEAAVGPAVERRAQGPEPFLSRGVPDLQRVRVPLYPHVLSS